MDVLYIVITNYTNSLALNECTIVITNYTNSLILNECTIVITILIV